MDGCSMIRLNIFELLKARGRTRYWLAKQMGMSHQNLTKLVNNDRRSIRLETIEVLCQILDCTPNDLFTIDFDKPEDQ